MGFPVGGELAKLTSWGAGGASDVLQLVGTACRCVEFTPSINGAALDITPLDASAVSRAITPGLNQGDTRLRLLYPQTAPTVGNVCYMTLAAATATRMQSFNLQLSVNALDITEFAATAPQWRRFRPSDFVTWRGGFEVMQESSAAAMAVALPGASSVAAEFYIGYVSGSDYHKFSGNIHRIQRSGTVKRGDKIIHNFTFEGTGNLTSAVAGSTYPAILPAGTVDTPDWDATGTDGVPDVSLILQYYTSRTITVPAFWRDINIRARYDGLVEVDVTAQWADTAVFA